MERSAVPRLRSCVSVKPVSYRVLFTSCLRKMWETIVTYTGNSFDNRKMLDMMVMGAKDYLAQTTPGDTWLDVSESDDGALSLKERK